MALDLETPGLESYRLSEFRYLPREPDRSRHVNRSLAYLFNGAERINTKSLPQKPVYLHAELPEYKLPLLEIDRRSDPAHRVDRRRQLHRNRRRWGTDQDEGRDLARSAIALPSDEFRRPARCPSLERQEAFRDPATSKRNLQASSISISSAHNDEDDVEVTNLYRLGLLYDDEHTRGSGFNLNTIVHDEPVYTLRPNKRARKINNTRGCDPELRLELSFAQLGHDDRIAQYLISPSPSEASDEELIQHRSEGRATTQLPLRVIYELIDSVADDNNNGGSSRSCHAQEAVPDLISDSEYYDDNDWAVVPDEKEANDDGTAYGNAADAWIVLG